MTVNYSIIGPKLLKLIFQFANRTFKAKPFEFLEDSPINGVHYADLAFGLPSGNPDHHFLRSILSEFKEKAVVLSYEK